MYYKGCQAPEKTQSCFLFLLLSYLIWPHVESEVWQAFTGQSVRSHAKHMRPRWQPRTCICPRDESVNSVWLPWSSAHKFETAAQCKQQAVWWMFNPKRGESSLNRSPKLRPKGGLRYLWTTGWGGTDHRQSIGGTTPNVSGLQQTGRDH